MRNFLLSLIVLTIATAVVIYRIVNPVDADEALISQVYLINIGEAALYFAGAYLLVCLAKLAVRYRKILTVRTDAEAQQLEFICRRFEDQFGHRSLFDPRGEHRL